MLSLLKSICINRKMIFKLAKNDFKAKYSGSFFGIIWAFAQPLITILVFWFVFQMGFKSAPVNDVPYILWFIPAYVPWIFFSDIMNASATCMLEYNYLVKKVKFNVEILPVVKILSASFVHVFFIVFIFFMYTVYHIPFSVYNLQVFYYSFATIVLGLGLGMFVSSVAVLFKDAAQIVMIMLQVGFWTIPIFWNPDTMSPWVTSVLKINPMYYIATGYRSSFMEYQPFWADWGYTIYFWIVTILIFIMGCTVFSRLRPHFADEL